MDGLFWQIDVRCKKMKWLCEYNIEISSGRFKELNGQCFAHAWCCLTSGKVGHSGTRALWSKSICVKNWKPWNSMLRLLSAVVLTLTLLCLEDKFVSYPESVFFCTWKLFWNPRLDLSS